MHVGDSTRKLLSTSLLMFLNDQNFSGIQCKLFIPGVLNENQIL
jgi:hypothetical protein